MKWTTWLIIIGIIGMIFLGGFFFSMKKETINNQDEQQVIKESKSKTAYTDKGDSLEIIKDDTLYASGEDKLSFSKDSPKVEINKWNGEANLTILYDGVISDGLLKEGTTKMEWTDTEESVLAYPIKIDGEVYQDIKSGEILTDYDGFEFEVILKSIPSTNIVDFRFEGWENYDFYFQPRLTKQEIQEGAYRPENVINSFAIYSKGKRDYIKGNINYGTGKIGHIYRLKAIDSNNNSVWIDNVNYTNGVLRAIVDQTWLNNAVYPVTIDPTFGYTTEGASTQTALAANDMYALTATATANTTIENLTIMHSVGGGAWKGVISTDETGPTIITNGVGESDTNLENTWTNSTFSTQPTVVEGTSYLLGWISSLQGGWHYDAGASGSSYRDTSNSYTTPADWGSRSARSEIISIYAVYSDGGGSPPTDSCTYSSGNWDVNCYDNCTITSDQTITPNNISIIGNGFFTLDGANITANKRFVTGGSGLCTVRRINGGRFILK